MDELTQRVAAAGCPPTDWQAPGITPSPVGRTYTQAEIDAAVAAVRGRGAKKAAPEHIPFSDDEWRVRCEIRDAILEA